MHIDWFIVLVFAITIPIAWWGFWIVGKDSKYKQKTGETASSEPGDDTSH